LARNFLNIVSKSFSCSSVLTRGRMTRYRRRVSFASLHRSQTAQPDRPHSQLGEIVSARSGGCFSASEVSIQRVSMSRSANAESVAACGANPGLRSPTIAIVTLSFSLRFFYLDEPTR
jgi:hypothetical protein